MDAFTLGGAILSLVEPQPGQARAFHRWYERDHFHAACMAGPGFFAGRRFIATRALKALRKTAAEPAWPDDAQRGSFLTLYWLAADAEDEAAAWSVERFHALHEAGRIFRAADLVHAGFYGLAAAIARDPDGVPPTLALDHPFPGVALSLVETQDREGLAAWHAAAATRGPVALSLGFVARPPPAGAVRATNAGDAPDRMAWLHFFDEPPEEVFDTGFGNYVSDLATAGMGRARFHAAFRPTLPGTDHHLDEL